MVKMNIFHSRGSVTKSMSHVTQHHVAKTEDRHVTSSNHGPIIDRHQSMTMAAHFVSLDNGQMTRNDHYTTTTALGHDNNGALSSINMTSGIITTSAAAEEIPMARKVSVTSSVTSSIISGE